MEPGWGAGTACGHQGPRDGECSLVVDRKGLPERLCPQASPTGLPLPSRHPRPTFFLLPPAFAPRAASSAATTPKVSGGRPPSGLGSRGPRGCPRPLTCLSLCCPQPASAPTAGGTSIPVTSSTAPRMAQAAASLPAAGPTAPSRGRSTAAAPPTPPPAPPSPSPHRRPVRQARWADAPSPAVRAEAPAWAPSQPFLGAP